MNIQQQNILLSEEIVAGRLAKNTRLQYKGKTATLVSWLKANEPTALQPSTDEMILPLNDTTISAFFGYICQKRKRDSLELEQPVQYLSLSHVANYRSAIKDYYKQKNITVPKSTENFMNEFMNGYTRKIAMLKQEGEMPLIEGKRPISFSGYQFLAEKAIKQDNDYLLAIFSHSFITLAWNLMARSVSVGQLMFKHISWENDCLVIVLPRHKGDQEGRNAFPKHIFANPLNPAVCPVLALAIYVFTKGYQRDEAKPLLFGHNSEQRFSKWLISVCKSNEDHFLTMGLEIADLGTHSFRKGCATQVSSSPGGPSAISVYLRAGWSLGNVQSRYIFDGQGGDHFVGRAATGLSINDTEFAVLPAHFNERNEPILSREEWESISPNYSTFFPREFLSVMPFLLASVTCHSEYIISQFPPAHPIFLSRLWTSGIINRLKSKVLGGVFQHEQSGITASGIPPHILIGSEIKKVQNKVDAMDHYLRNQMGRDVTQTILNNCQVNGAVPITHQQVESMLLTLQQNLSTVFSQSVNQAVREETQIGTENQPFTIYTWGGRLHPVPEGFRFPSRNIHLRVLWDLWWIGNPALRIGPYRKIHSYDLQVKADKAALSKASFVIHQLLELFNDDLTNSNRNLSQFSIKQLDETFKVVFPKFMNQIYPNKSEEEIDLLQKSDSSYITLYDLAKKSSKQANVVI